MSKKPAPSSSQSTFTEHNPAEIFERIEHESTGLPAADPYRARIEALMEAALDNQGDRDNAADAVHIRETTVGLVLETAARRTGFVLGFEYFRDLILSAGKGGGR